eukprot:scaffold70822_cov92-Phaeocystis_antarctica.AAC.1
MLAAAVHTRCRALRASRSTRDGVWDVWQRRFASGRALLYLDPALLTWDAYSRALMGNPDGDCHCVTQPPWGTRPRTLLRTSPGQRTCVL